MTKENIWTVRRPLIVTTGKTNGEYSDLDIVAVFDLTAQRLRKFEELFHFARLCCQSEQDLVHLSFEDDQVRFFQIADNHFLSEQVEQMGTQNWAVASATEKFHLSSAIEPEYCQLEVHRDRYLGWTIGFGGEELYAGRLYWEALAELKPALREDAFVVV